MEYEPSVQLQSDSLDLESILNNLSHDQLYESFIPTDTNFEPSFGSTVEDETPRDNFADFFQQLPDIPSATGVRIKPDPDAPFHLPFSSEFLAPGMKKRKAVLDLPKDDLAKKQRLLPQAETLAIVPVNKPQSKRGTRERDEKYLRRLKANKKSAQASRERRKHLKIELEQNVHELSEETKMMETEITQLETENKVLKGEFVQLQKLISESAILSKLMARAASMQLAASDNERMMKEASLKTPPLSKDGVYNINPAAFMYLLIVLQSFGQYFTSMNQQTMKQQMSTPTSNGLTPLAVM